MKTLATILCLFSVAANAAFGFSGGYLFCKHDSGQEHLVSKAAHVQETHSESCHASAFSVSESNGANSNCNSCVDTEIELKAPLDDATQVTERSVVKVPLVTEYAPIESFVLVSVSCRTAESLPARAPPLVFSALVQYSATVQFRI